MVSRLLLQETKNKLKSLKITNVSLILCFKLIFMIKRGCSKQTQKMKAEYKSN